MESYRKVLVIDVSIPLEQGSKRYVTLTPDAKSAHVLNAHGCVLRHDAGRTTMFWDGKKDGELVVQLEAKMTHEPLILCEHAKRSTPQRLQFDATVDASGGVSYGSALQACDATEARMRVGLRLALNDAHQPTLSLIIPPVLVYWTYFIVASAGMAVSLSDKADMLAFEELPEKILPDGRSAFVWRSTQKVDEAAFFGAIPMAQIGAQDAFVLPRP